MWIIDGDSSVNCELYCNRWFHIKCVNIVKNDYDKIMGNHNKWFYTPCEETFHKRKDEKMCCDCFSYISIPTDSVKELSENHKEMSHSLNLIMMEQKNMRKYTKEDDAARAFKTEYNQLRPSIENSDGNKDPDGDRFYTSGSQGRKRRYIIMSTVMALVWNMMKPRQFTERQVRLSQASK